MSPEIRVSPEFCHESRNPLDPNGIVSTSFQFSKEIEFPPNFNFGIEHMADVLCAPDFEWQFLASHHTGITAPVMGVWQGVAMDSLKFHPGPPCPTLLRPAGGLRPSASPLDTSLRPPMALSSAPGVASSVTPTSRRLLMVRTS
jgi:hypothetical protein